MVVAIESTEETVVWESSKVVGFIGASSSSTSPFFLVLVPRSVYSRFASTSFKLFLTKSFGFVGAGGGGGLRSRTTYGTSRAEKITKKKTI